MWGIIVLLVVGLFQLFQNPQERSMVLEKTPFSEFLKNVDDGRVVQVEIKGNTIEGIVPMKQIPEAVRTRDDPRRCRSIPDVRHVEADRLE